MQPLIIDGYVRVTNQSGEDYANAQTRLLVGKINLIDRIIDLARRKYPIEGTETIPNGWGKRLPSFKQSAIPVISMYKYDEKRWGKRVLRFFQFNNDKDHKMGKEPLPGGHIKVFRRIDEEGHLAFEGASKTRYIPIGEKVELSLGEAKVVRVEPVMMDFRTDHFLFNHRGDLSGWDEHRNFRVEVRNFRSIRIKVEVWRHFSTSHWVLVNEGNYGLYEKVDLKTVKYTLELPPNSSEVFTYKLTTHHGRRADEHEEPMGQETWRYEQK